jgi:hypothetical protein
VNRGGPVLGALGAVTGGGNSFTFTQNNSNSLDELSNLNTGDEDQDNTATFNETMRGTETYAPGGSVSGGSDSFTWTQIATDSEALGFGQSGNTLTTYTLYSAWEFDTISDNYTDVGTDILGASDSILHRHDHDFARHLHPL